MSNSHKEIQLFLNSSQNATSFYNELNNTGRTHINNLLHVNEFERALSLIAKAMPSGTFSDKPENQHRAITVLGTRGSGKSSFLKTVAAAIKQNAPFPTSNNRGEDIFVLETIDPTLIEEKGHIFLTVISTITTEVQKEIDKITCNPQDKSRNNSCREWEKALSKLALGLPSIDGIGHSNTDRWEDAEYVMQNGLKAVHAARTLFEHFHEFLELSLTIVKKKAFLLIFDDIDVDSSKGWKVLETVRKYLGSPYLITILSGDIKLFSTVVRQTKWRNFGREILQYEGTEYRSHDGSNKRLDGFNDIVTELTAQYLLKILQPESRIHLTTLLEKKAANDKLDIIVHDFHPLTKIAGNVTIQEVYKYILKYFGIYNSTNIEVYNTFILGLPLRSQIQFMLTMRVIDRNPTREIKRQLISHLPDVFMADLYEKNVDINLAKSTPKYLSAISLKLLLQEKRLQDLYQLQPNTTDGSLNSCLVALSLLYAIFIQENNCFLIFDYIIRVGHIRNVALSLAYKEDLKLNESEKPMPSIEELCDRCGLFNDNILRDVMGHIEGYIFGAHKNSYHTQASATFTYLPGLHGRQKKRGTFQRLDYVFSPNNPNTNYAKNLLGTIPGFVLMYNYRQSTEVGYSPYMLLSTIGELIKRYEIVANAENHSEKRRIIKTTLRDLAQLRTYPIVNFNDNNIPGFKDSDTDIQTKTYSQEPNDNHNSNIDTSLDKLTDLIFNWLSQNSLQKPIQVAPYLLGKISTRYYFALSNFMSKIPNNISFGTLFSTKVILFMNAILIEDVKENGQNEINININNIISSNKIFANNLSNSINYSKKKPTNEQLHTDDSKTDHLLLSKWLLSCPLLLPYLDVSSNSEAEKLKSLLLDYCNGYINPEIFDFSISNLLDSLEVKSKDEKENKLKDYITFQIDSASANDLLKNPESLAHLLGKYGYPFEWFDQDQKQTYFRNQQIEKYLSSIFDVNKKGLQANVRDFRKKIKELKIKW